MERVADDDQALGAGRCTAGDHPVDQSLESPAHGDHQIRRRDPHALLEPGEAGDRLERHDDVQHGEPAAMVLRQRRRHSQSTGGGLGEVVRDEDPAKE